jgi:AsmA protein
MVDANARLGVDEIRFQKIRTGRADVDAKLNAGKLTANLTRMALYEGQGDGLVTVDATQPATPAIGAGFKFNNISAQPLLKDAADLDWLSGRGTVTLNVSTRGNSQFDMVKALNGKAAIDIADGAIEGFNFAKLVRSLGRGDLSGLSATSAEKTDFSALTATFDIQNGVVANNDLKMLSPLLRVSGEGQVMLPPRQVDYTVTPKLVSSLSGQGGDTGLEGLAEVPVRIHGPLDDPKYTPKLDAIVKDPSKTVETIKKLRDRFRGKDAGEIVNDLLGGGSAGEGGEKKIDGKELLRGLFGR